MEQWKLLLSERGKYGAEEISLSPRDSLGRFHAEEIFSAMRLIKKLFY
jgi:hypothetical protein